MKNSWFNKIVYSCFLFILAASCSKHTYRHAEVTGNFDQTIRSDFFKKDSIHYFKTSITTYGKALSGILAIKKQGDDTLKVSFFTEMGVSFFDVLVTHDSYQLVRCISQLNSKPVMNTIVEDIRWVVLFNRNQLSNPSIVKSNTAQKTARFNYQDAYIFAELSKDNEPLVVTYVYGSKFKSKFEIRYASFENSLPGKVFVEHINFDLKIDLTAISFAE